MLPPCNLLERELLFRRKATRINPAREFNRRTNRKAGWVVSNIVCFFVYTILCLKVSATAHFYAAIYVPLRVVDGFRSRLASEEGTKARTRSTDF